MLLFLSSNDSLVQTRRVARKKQVSFRDVLSYIPISSYHISRLTFNGLTSDSGKDAKEIEKKPAATDAAKPKKKKVKEGTCVC